MSREKSKLGNLVGLGFIGFAVVIGYLHLDRKKEKVSRYKSLPHSEILDSFDRNKNGAFEMRELESLFKDYELVRRKDYY